MNRLGEVSEAALLGIIGDGVKLGSALSNVSETLDWWMALQGFISNCRV